MLNKSGPKKDPCATQKNKSFQELKEVPILVLSLLSFQFLVLSHALQTCSQNRTCVSINRS